MLLLSSAEHSLINMGYGFERELPAARGLHFHFEKALTGKATAAGGVGGG